ncbi:MAG: SpoIVB peptidase [Acetivibrionales bacterium]
MRFVDKKRSKFIIFLAVCVTIMTVTYLKAIFTVPAELTLIEGEEYSCGFKSPFLVNIIPDKEGIVQLYNSGFQAAGNFFQLSNPVSVKTNKKGTVNLNMRLLGLIPLKTMKVDIVSSKKLAACGNTVGVKLKVDGILVIGVSDVEALNGKKEFPARDTGIRPGDIIIKVNGRAMNEIDDLIEEIDGCNGEDIDITYKRGSMYNYVKVRPVKAFEDKRYHIGLWVRDSTAGIGTLTFYDRDTGSFGALGHGITDVDTGALMPVKSGEILESNILGIRKGKEGNPGELKGVFIEDKNKLGTIRINSDYGIYGTLNDGADRLINSRLYPIGLRSQVKEGPAIILSNINGKKVREYQVNIERVSRQNVNGSKGMIIRITDKKLLDATGGIVQGMSGSPIIQDGRIIGAVTHVLVNDPTKGYGIFIEAMIKNVLGNNAAYLQKAG